ncbi:inhibitor of KinA sporulation pathway (predicted exonuclease) [Thioalbus denitrificans]|uniref:Inhibitor of KinA sporulation pathway (Predicted exonuclease) n=2 Tax=Thioalbus denitrificans TaxID=547122 RepID=A0A369CJE7_9GAMM|nr:inhibitor of KinA sporulation pathway (predicted exonuclease) [Thioalbus denitrificans]
MNMRTEPPAIATPLLVVDLEATCWDPNDRSRPAPRPGWRYAGEIIEIGAMRVDPRDWRILQRFQTFVRPSYHPQLSDYCRRLTHIRQEDVDSAPTFPQALAAFVQAFAIAPDQPPAWGSWGAYDLLQLEDECRKHGLPFPLAGARHTNLKDRAARQLGTPRRGIAATLRHLGLKFEGVPHRALEDVRNIVRVLEAADLQTPPPTGP